MGTNLSFVDIAEQLKPTLYETVVYPTQVIEVVEDANAFQGWQTKPIESYESLSEKSFGKNDSFILDFGDHQVGYLTLALEPVGYAPDAPLRLKLTFGEMPCEVAESFDTYDGWLSRSWLQDEIINVDVLPDIITLPRRYCFRYLKIEVIDTSVRYKVKFADVYCTSVTSGDIHQVASLPEHIEADLQEIDRISVKTLQDCMQTVFEDGPKRDRRLWIGDLRLQALANYYTFQNYDLVKRCLYLFGGLTLEDGVVGACVFEKPHPVVDDTRLYDYSLFFVATLYDYYEATHDRQTLLDLWPTAFGQIEMALQRLDANGVLKDDESWWCFTDWHTELNKQAPAQAILLYCLKRGKALADALGRVQEAAHISKQIAVVSNGAIQQLWDAELGFLSAGEGKQVSWASQIWMVLAEVFDKTENGQIMDRLFEQSPAIGMTTPYIYHHLIEALISSGRKEKALEQIRAYWGEMVKDGADCFWELYNPSDKKLSPYGSNLINSYCHAWSCTPAYFIRKYDL